MNEAVLRVPAAPGRDASLAGASARAASRHGVAPRLFLNGRFLTQVETGVQRYAREIAQALDAVLAERGEMGRIVRPAGPVPALPWAAMDLAVASPLQGHAWEQLVLPGRCTRAAPLLNLCNTAPLARGRHQVVCMHDANVFVQPQSYSRAFRTVYRTLLPLLARGGARLTTVSQDAARQLAAVLPVAERDITVLPNGHEHVFRWRPERSRLLENTPARRPFVLALGSRARHKNLGLLLGLAPALDALGLDLMVAGGGAAVFAASEMALAPNVRQLGRVSDDDLAALFGQALCLAFPSLTEGFGLPVLEAMALGCPVVSTDRASLPEVCGTAALMADPTRPGDWVAHIAALAGSPSLRQDFAQRGRAQARSFSWRRSAEGYLAVLAA